MRAIRAIELYVPAEVNGNLQAPEIFMDKGVRFTGNCTMAKVNADEAASPHALNLDSSERETHENN